MPLIEQERQRNLTAVSHADCPSLIRDVLANGIVRPSRTFVERTGYSASELKPEPLLEWVKPTDRVRFQEVLEQGEGSLEAAHRTKQGQWIEFDWRIKSREGRTVALGILKDLHPQTSQPRRAQADELPSTMHGVLEEMARIIEDERPGLKCSVLLLDDDGLRIVGGAGPSLPDEYNKAVEGLLIGPAVGSCGTAAFWGEPVVVEDIQNDVLWRDLKDIAKQAGVASCWSHPIRTKNGKILGATALYSPTPRIPTQHELDGLATAARMFGLEIERAYAEQALEKSKAARARRESELEDQLHQAAKMEALGVLAGGVAHDFNNMLVTVLGNAEIAMTTVPEKGDTYQMLEDIVEASKSATELCSQMLAYAGRGVMSTQRLECNALIRKLGGLLQVAISKKASLDYDLCEQLLYVEADQSQLSQVIMNLITNASDALMSEPGQIQVATGIDRFDSSDLKSYQIGDATVPGTYVWLKVSDNGCGMDPETQEKMFDPFFTTKFTGRGLGMAAVRGIVLRHQGHIQIVSQPGGGTTCTLLLPSANSASVVPVRQTSETLETKRKRIMIVDDETKVRRTLERVLRISDFDVIQACDGRDAIEIYRKEHDSIDGILLDLSMPNLDGEETFRELKKIRTDVRVVLNSGYAEEDILNRMKGAGFAGLLHKPTPTKILIATLRKVTEGP